VSSPCAIAAHATTLEKVWFNQAHLFHVSSLNATVKESLVNMYGEENSPRNSYYGDATPIEVETLNIIRDVYARSTISFPWENSDLLLLDNMLFSHGRNPFSGGRKILVGLARANKW